VVKHVHVSDAGESLFPKSFVTTYYYYYISI